MSRRYCIRCKAPHGNTWQSACTPCLEAIEQEENDRRNEAADALNDFMALSEEDRWHQVFEFMKERGWTLYG